MTTAQKWKVAGALVAVALPALLNYLSARAESSEANIRAEVAYSQMVESVKELQDTVHELELSQARLTGQVGAMEQMRPVGYGVNASAPAPETAPKREMKAPPLFEDAVREYKASKK